MPGTADSTASLYFCLSVTVVLTVVGGIPCSCLTSPAHLPISKSVIIFNFISKVGTTLGFLGFSLDFADMGTESVAKIN
jgi:hypothetical protein